jgi:hypothetical protein
MRGKFGILLKCERFLANFGQKKNSGSCYSAIGNCDTEFWNLCHCQVENCEIFNRSEWEQNLAFC